MTSDNPQPNQKNWNANDDTPSQQPLDPDTFQHPGQEFPTEEPKKKKSTAEKVGIAIAAVVILGVGGYFSWQKFAVIQALQPGNCLVTTGADNSIDIKEVSCDDKTQASLKVIKALPEGETSCGDDYEVTIWRDTGNRFNKKKTYYCLQPNLHADTCYKIVKKEPAIEKCGTSEAVFKVVKQLPGEDASCESGQEPLKLPGTGVTSCIVAGR